MPGLHSGNNAACGTTLEAGGGGLRVAKIDSHVPALDRRACGVGGRRTAVSTRFPKHEVHENESTRGEEDGADPRVGEVLTIYFGFNS